MFQIKMDLREAAIVRPCEQANEEKNNDFREIVWEPHIQRLKREKNGLASLLGLILG